MWYNLIPAAAVTSGLELVDVGGMLTSLATDAKAMIGTAAPVIFGVASAFVAINLGFKMFKKFTGKLG